MSMTRAKLHFELAMSDLERIQGYRRQGARSMLTMYYVNDQRDGAIAKHGQDHFDNRVPKGKELLGVAARERAEKEEKDRLAAQAGRDCEPYAVVPPERLGNLGFDGLQALLVCCEGGKIPLFNNTKAVCIEHILRAGYDMSAEEAEMGRQKAVDDEERERQRAALEQARAEAEAKAERTRRFAYGTLSIDDLNYNKIKEHLVRLGVPGKERVAIRRSCAHDSRWHAALARGRRRTTRLERNRRAQRKRQSDTVERVKDTRRQHDN